MGDYIVRAMSADGFVKAAAIRSTEIVRRGAAIQGTTTTATAAFGRALTATSLLGNMQKVEDGSVTLQIKGGGPLGTILCVSDSVGNVRGYVQHPVISLMEKYPGKLDVGAAVGREGMLTVIRDLQMKEPYVGSVQMVTGEIAEDLTAYFAQSEQTPTACALGVLVARDRTVQVAGGYLLQLLPNAPDGVIEALEGGIRGAGRRHPYAGARHDAGGDFDSGLPRNGTEGPGDHRSVLSLLLQSGAGEGSPHQSGEKGAGRDCRRRGDRPHWLPVL